jgi:hypothetical protein
VPSQVNNFVADVNYTTQINDDLNVKVGASYMKGSAYCREFPVVHFTPCKKSNPASTAYVRVNFQDRLLIVAAFATTSNE